MGDKKRLLNDSIATNARNKDNVRGKKSKGLKVKSLISTF